MFLTNRTGARRFLIVNAVIAAIVAIGLFVPSQLSTGNRVGAFALAAKPHMDGMEAVKGERNQEGGLTTLSDQLNAERSYPQGGIPSTAYSNGVNTYNLMSNVSAPLNWQQVGPTSAPSANFPDPYSLNATAVSGRMTAIQAAPSTCHVGGCDTIYAGTANGSVWKSTDGGSTWKVINDGSSINTGAFSTAIGTLTVDPVNENILYVGLGEPNFSADSNRGTGIMRTVDGGAHWTNLGFSTFYNRAISALVIDPRGAGSVNTETIYVTSNTATAGGGTTGGSCSTCAPARALLGFFKGVATSTGGMNFTHSNPAYFGTPAYTSVRAFSIAQDPSNLNTLFATFWPGGIFKSTNDGTTWSGPIGSGIPGAPTSTNGYDRMTVVIAPSNSNVLYVSADYNFSRAVYFKSIDGGSSFSRLPTAPNVCNGQCWYDQPIAVDPTNANVLYAGGQANYDWLFAGDGGFPCSVFTPFAATCSTSLAKTSNGGTTWSDIAENGSDDLGNGAGPLHPDNHVIFIDPADSNTVYTGTDGGLFKTTDAGQSFRDLNNGIASFQFTGIGVGPTGAVFGGTQDNGTFRLDPGTGVATHVNAGDGGQAVADPSNPNTAYYAYYGSSMLRDEDALGPNVYPGGIPHFFPTIWIAPWSNDGGQFYQPRAVSPVPGYSNYIFAGTNRILRSNRQGGIDGNGDTDATNDPSDDPGGSDTNPAWVPMSNSSTFGGGNISAIALSPTNPNVMAVATTLGRIYYTNNALATPSFSGSACDSPRHNGSYSCTYNSGINWTRIDGKVAGTTPNRYPSSLRFAPGSANVLYVAFSGFNANAAVAGHIFQGTINGSTATWKNLNGSAFTASLPDLPFSDVLANPKTPSHLYASADYGIYFSADNGGHWLRMDNGLPNTPVYQLQYDPTTNTLLAATHGRGIWRSAAP